jgi:cupin 2 domain-containing protein
MIPLVRNLFTEASGVDGAEEFHTLLEGGAFRLESIVSRGQSSEPDFWYDQPQAEWVLLMVGMASLTFEGGEELNLKAGDYLLIPPRCRHRVKEASPNAVWLALHVAMSALDAK